MVADRGLSHVAAGREVARADLGVGRELPNDREARGVGERLEEADVRVDEGGLRARHERMVSMDIDIDKYQYMRHPADRHSEGDPMDHNIAAWMIAGGPHVETQQTQREREQLHAFIESHRAAERGPSVLERIRLYVRPVASTEPACCPA